MRIPRFIWPSELRTTEASLSPDQARHGVRVLRLNVGAVVEMVSAEGLAPAVVTAAKNKPPILEVRLTGPWQQEKIAGAHLALALIQKQRFDWVVEKAVELGAARLIPLVTERTKPDLSAAARLERWHRLAEEARKQCGRAYRLEISPVTELDRFLVASAEEGGVARRETFFLHPYGDETNEPLPLKEEALIVVGPEGGFSPTEEEALCNFGAKPWYLGPQIFRTETAALVALARLR